MGAGLVACSEATASAGGFQMPVFLILILLIFLKRMGKEVRMIMRKRMRKSFYSEKGLAFGLEER